MTYLGVMRGVVGVLHFLRDSTHSALLVEVSERVREWEGGREGEERGEGGRAAFFVSAIVSGVLVFT